MLGEKIGEMKGSITGQRVLPPDGPAPKLETSFDLKGKVLGLESTFLGTYWATVRADGTLYGECPRQGVFLTSDGDIAQWSAAGVGKPDGQGGTTFRGALYAHAGTGKLAPLSDNAIVYEWDADAQGQAQITFWEWK